MTPAVSESSLQAVEKVFTWFNDLGERRIPLHRADVERFFDPDLALMIDMKVMAKGTDAMVQRMTEMLAKTRWWGVTPLPFEFCLSEGNMVAACQTLYPTELRAQGFSDCAARTYISLDSGPCRSVPGHADHPFRDDRDHDSGIMPITRSGMVPIS
jgi:hypothetical protein